MLLIPCECGAKLRVKDEVAGHRVKCPRCAAVIRAPLPPGAVASTPPAAVPKPRPAAPAAPKKPTAAKPVARPATEDDVAPLDLLEQLSSGEQVEMQPMPVIPAEPAIGLGYAPDPSRVGIKTGKVIGDVIQGPHRGFWVDLLRAFIFPFQSAGNAFNFSVIAFLVVCAMFVPNFFCLGLVAALIMLGWTASIYMNVVSDTAAGSDVLPGPKMEEGWYGDIIQPAIMFVGTFAIAMLPMIAFLILVATGIAPDSPLLFFIWLTMGIFLWPMIMLLFALGAHGMIARLDLIFVTIARTILPYLVIWAGLLAVFVLRTIISFGPLLARLGLNLNMDFKMSASEQLAFAVFFEVVNFYFMIVSMRIIGLYYLHFKRKFAFELE